MINQIDQTIFRLHNLNTEQSRISYQMSTGKKLQQGSDDSILFAREIFIDDKIRTFEGLQSQIERTNAQNVVSDSIVSDVKELLDYVKTQLIKANTDTTTPEGLRSIAVDIEGVKENLFDLANTQIDGEYLFSGLDTSVQAFTKNSDGSISYSGDNQLRKVIVDEGSYRERGINGFDLMSYAISSGAKGETISFSSENKIFDENGNEWKLNATNDTLEKYDLDGTKLTDTLAVTSDGGTPPTFSTTLPSTDGTRFEVKTSIFDSLDKTVNALNGLDSVGNPISSTDAKSIVSENLSNFTDAYSSVNVAHAKLGGRNRIFEISLERVSAKLTQYNILSQEIGAADLSKVAMEAKALELTYTALYSTINRTNQLSLVNFLN